MHISACVCISRIVIKFHAIRIYQVKIKNFQLKKPQLGGSSRSRNKATCACVRVCVCVSVNASVCVSERVQDSVCVSVCVPFVQVFGGCRVLVFERGVENRRRSELCL